MRQLFSQYIPVQLWFILFFIPTVISAQSAWPVGYYNRFNQNNYYTYSYFDSLVNANRFDHALLNAAVFYESNKQRIKYGLRPLMHHPKLEQSAQGHSKDMVEYNFYSHTSRVPGKSSISDRIRKTGLNGNWVGENIFDHYILNINGEAYYPPSQYGFFKSATTGKRIEAYTYRGLAEALVTGWMNSPGHRANILDNNYTHMGMGNFAYYKGLGIDRIPYVKSTQNFARIETVIASSENRKGSSHDIEITYQELTTFCLIVGFANVFNSIDELTSADGHYQAIMQLGLLKGERDDGQNFYGTFTSLDLYDKNLLGLEIGTIWHSCIRLSAGYKLQNFEFKNLTSIPTATIGLRIPFGSMFAALDYNVFKINGKKQNNYLAAIGINF